MDTTATMQSGRWLLVAAALAAIAGCGDGSVDPSVDPAMRGRAGEGGAAGGSIGSVGGAGGVALSGAGGQGGSAPMSCPAYQALCNGACIDVTTTAHCGACNNVCSSGQSCSNGQCVGGGSAGAAGGTGGANGGSGAGGSSGNGGSSGGLLPLCNPAGATGYACHVVTSAGPITAYSTLHPSGEFCEVCSSPSAPAQTPCLPGQADLGWVCVSSCSECW